MTKPHATTRTVWAAATTLQQSGRLVTHRAIATLTGLRSTSTVEYHFQQLENAGYISRWPGTRGTLRVRVPLYTMERNCPQTLRWSGERKEETK